MNWPQFTGPTLVTLLDGTMAFSDAESWRHELEARQIAAMPAKERAEYLFDIERIRGVDAASALRKTIDEVIAVTALARIEEGGR